jgi:hypothetical protein
VVLYVAIGTGGVWLMRQVVNTRTTAPEVVFEVAFYCTGIGNENIEMRPFLPDDLKSLIWDWWKETSHWTKMTVSPEASRDDAAACLSVSRQPQTATR